ncbi:MULTISPECIES: hypothetical protein [Spirulina sp. CCY15215]|uniref:hypothetical protein n=1 Tax=Spirulina sp. CCY15215 TaxID=2767591 RepID=UPI0019514613|nr:hypothetical protein [Spirulina major]
MVLRATSNIAELERSLLWVVSKSGNELAIALVGSKVVVIYTFIPRIIFPIAAEKITAREKDEVS